MANKESKQPKNTPKTTSKPVAKKAVSKKVTPTKKPKKTTAIKPKKAVKKTLPRNTKPRQPKKVAEPKIGGGTQEGVEAPAEVILPSSMSIRAREKKLVLESEFYKYLSRSAQRISFVTGLCLALVGSMYAGATYFGEIAPPNQSAQVVDFGSTINTVVPKPTFSFTSQIPDNTTTDFPIGYKVTDAQKVEAKLVFGSQMIPTSVQKQNQDVYRSYIQTANLQPGSYRLRVYITPLNGTPQITFDSKSFIVQAPPVAVLDSATQNELEDTTNSGTTIDPILSDSQFTTLTQLPTVLTADFLFAFTVTNSQNVKTGLRNTKTNTITKLSTTARSNDRYETTVVVAGTPAGFYDLVIESANAITGTIEKFTSRQFEIQQNTTLTSTSSSVVPKTTTPTSSTTKPQQPPTENTNPKPPVTTTENTPSTQPATNELSISSKVSTLQGIFELQVNIPPEYSFAELYARPINSIQSKFITRASQTIAGWRFSFDTLTLPNGEYEFYAIANANGKSASSKSLVLTVANPAPITRTVSTTQPSDRPFVETQPYTKPEPAPQSSTVEVAAFELLTSQRSVFDDLFKRYAIAQQSGNQMLIDSLKRELDQQRTELVSRSITNTSTRDISYEIDTKLQETLADLEEKVVTFERIRADRSAGTTAVDSDQDGISDFDEINLYQTDPAIPDTDQDGITDGVEIIRGYDPLNASPEVVVNFESPKETVGLIREDALAISTVLPVQQAVPEEGAALVTAEIRGVALPNSFVTLFIYSNPVIVTVKTDADGSFVYTLDKELEDGTHDVFVAITDNAGEIIAHSNPFTFIKEAQAFTPVDAVDTQVISSDNLIDTTSYTYRVVAGTGVLALGLILLMLGISLKSRQQDEVIITENPAT